MNSNRRTQSSREICLDRGEMWLCVGNPGVIVRLSFAKAMSLKMTTYQIVSTSHTSKKCRSQESADYRGDDGAVPQRPTASLSLKVLGRVGQCDILDFCCAEPSQELCTEKLFLQFPMFASCLFFTVLSFEKTIDIKKAPFRRPLITSSS